MVPRLTRSRSLTATRPDTHEDYSSAIHLPVVPVQAKGRFFAERRLIEGVDGSEFERQNRRRGRITCTQHVRRENALGSKTWLRNSVSRPWSLVCADWEGIRDVMYVDVIRRGDRTLAKRARLPVRTVAKWIGDSFEYRCAPQCPRRLARVLRPHFSDLA
jgi:hypothetical protein